MWVKISGESLGPDKGGEVVLEVISIGEIMIIRPTFYFLKIYLYIIYNFYFLICYLYIIDMPDLF